jgi:hypothetical protein
MWWIPGALLLFPLSALFNLLPRNSFTFEPGAVFGLVTWFVIWLWLGYRLTSIRCPFCANRAFGLRPFFSTHRLKCVACERALFE